jgi:hypothetical protein
MGGRGGTLKHGMHAPRLAREEAWARLLARCGIRLFDGLTGTPSVLGNPMVIQGVGVTHLRYPVRRA